MTRQAVPDDPTFKLLEAYRAAWRELGKVIDTDREAELGEILGGLQARLREEPATTIAGLRAKVAHMRDHPEGQEGRVPELLAMIAASLDAIGRA